MSKTAKKTDNKPEKKYQANREIRKGEEGFSPLQEMLEDRLGVVKGSFSGGIRGKRKW